MNSKNIFIWVGVIAIGVVVVILLRIYDSFLTTSLPAPAQPATVSATINGQLFSSSLAVGQHTLKLRAKTSNGQIIEETRTFMVADNSSSSPLSTPAVTPSPSLAPSLLPVTRPSPSALPSVPPSTKTQCSDGIDNDNDGAADFDYRNSTYIGVQDPLPFGGDSKCNDVNDNSEFVTSQGVGHFDGFIPLPIPFDIKGVSRYADPSYYYGWVCNPGEPRYNSVHHKNGTSTPLSIQAVAYPSATAQDQREKQITLDLAYRTNYLRDPGVNAACGGYAWHGFQINMKDVNETVTSVASPIWAKYTIKFFYEGRELPGQALEVDGYGCVYLNGVLQKNTTYYCGKSQ